MPFKTNAELPPGVKVLPGAAQSIWRNVFNDVEGKGRNTQSAAQQAWGAVRNAGYSKNDEGKWVKKSKVFKADIAVTGVNESLGIVFGWGMVTDIDNEPYFDDDNQHINSSVMIKATSDFMENSRTSNDSHTETDIGTVIHSFPVTKEIAESMGIESNISGWMVGVKPTTEILQKFLSGEYTGFSIEGEGIMEDLE